MPAAEPGLSSPKVLAPFVLHPDFTRSVEQVGSAYEQLKAKVAKQLSRFEETQRKKQADPAHESSSSSSEGEEEEEEKGGAAEEKSDEWRKKRHKRTKEDIEKEVLLMGDLYGILDLAHLTYEAGDSDIKQAYKKLALMYHPDKLGEGITEQDKEIWLKI